MPARDCGHTLIELLIAMLVMALLISGVVLVAINTQRLAQVVPLRFDQQQRARVALDLIARDLRHAGVGVDVGPDAGPLANVLPGVWPHRLSSGLLSASSSAITTIGVVGEGLQSSLRAPLAAGATTWTITRADWCGARAACGARVGDDVMVWTGDGRFDLATVAAVAADAVTVRSVLASGGGYPAGTAVAAVTVRTYAFDAGRAQLRLSVAGGSEQPLVDGVRAFTVSWDLASGVGLTSASFASLRDGPWRGSGASMWDDDLRRVRLVHLQLELDAADPRVGPFVVSTAVAVRNTCPSCCC